MFPLQRFCRQAHFFAANHAHDNQLYSSRINISTPAQQQRQPGLKSEAQKTTLLLLHVPALIRVGPVAPGGRLLCARVLILHLCVQDVYHNFASYGTAGPTATTLLLCFFFVLTLNSTRGRLSSAQRTVSVHRFW